MLSVSQQTLRFEDSASRLNGRGRVLNCVQHSAYNRAMTSSPPILDVDGRDTARLRWCVSVFGLLLGFATWPLWAPEGEYPLIPWFEVLRGVPTGVDRLLAYGIVLSGIGVAVMTVREWVRPRPVERDRPDDQGLAGVHSPNGGISLSLPPLPHNRYGFRSGLHCGGEGRGEGA